jgi:hypothetical protein
MGNSLFFPKQGGGGVPPTKENQTSKGFPVFSGGKTGNWTKLGVGTLPLGIYQSISPFFKASLTEI